MAEIKIIAISDTHNKHNTLDILPECDILIHAGDWSGMGRASECQNFAKWLAKQPAKNIVIVPGNHEVEFESQLPQSKEWLLSHCPKAHILIEESIEIGGIKIYGSPITPWFFDWAWNRSTREDGIVKNSRTGKIKTVPYIKPHWDKIPEDTDILITHGPPYGIGDQVLSLDGIPLSEPLGCPLLRDRINEINPDIHIFGHIHSGTRKTVINKTSYYNIAVCDEAYDAANGFTEIYYEK